MRTTLLAALLALAAPACTSDITGGAGPGGTGGTGGDTGGGTGGTGGGGDTGGSGTGSGVSASVSVSLDRPTVNTELGKTEMLSLTVSSQGGYAGNVPVVASIVDGNGTAITGWTLTPTPTSVDLTAGSSTTVALLVKVPSDAAMLTPTVKVAMDGAEVASAFTVKNQLTITIDDGTGTTAPHSTLPAPNAPIKVRMGAKVIFHNADSVPHEIHAGGGIPHEGGPLNPGADYITTPTGDATWYCHAHEGNSNISRLINVQ